MNTLTHLQELDNLIIEHTRPPVTTVLRNKLSLATEQAEAHSDAVAKQDQTLATQIETIERLMKEKAEAIAKYDQACRKSSDALHQKGADYEKTIRGRELSD